MDDLRQLTELHDLLMTEYKAGWTSEGVERGIENMRQSMQYSHGRDGRLGRTCCSTRSRGGDIPRSHG